MAGADDGFLMVVIDPAADNDFTPAPLSRCRRREMLEVLAVDFDREVIAQIEPNGMLTALDMTYATAYKMETMQFWGEMLAVEGVIVRLVPDAEPLFSRMFFRFLITAQGKGIRRENDLACETFFEQDS